MGLLRLFRQSGAELFDLRRLVRSRRQQLQAEIRRMTQFAYLGDRIGLCRVLGRYKMYVDTRDVGVASHLIFDGYWEMWVTEVLIERMRRGMIAVDVGANLGYFSLVMAEMVGAEGWVHAFEPNPAMATHLVRSAHVNGFRERVHHHPEPLGAENGERVLLHVPEFYPGGATTYAAPPEQVEHVLVARRLDSFTELLDADVIKIDAEGAEQAIWRGMTGIFARGRPMMILLEFVASRYPDPALFIDEIVAEGFALMEVSAATSPRPITKAQILSAPRDEDVMLVLVR